MYLIIISINLLSHLSLIYLYHLMINEMILLLFNPNNNYNNIILDPKIFQDENCPKILFILVWHCPDPYP